MSNEVLVAIDGPAGAGKTSVARGTADAVGYTYIDTGAMYRAVAYKALQADLDVQQQVDEIATLAGRLSFEFRDCDGQQRLFVDGEDVSEVIRTGEVGNLSSPVSAIPELRQHLVDAQRQMAAGGGAIMEGRDIGTVVLPNAGVKIFLTASAPERARRRQKQLKESGVKRPFDDILADIRTRDERDSTRAVAPLKKADDAVEIVTDNMTKAAVIERITQLIRDAEDEQ